MKETHQHITYTILLVSVRFIFEFINSNQWFFLDFSCLLICFKGKCFCCQIKAMRIESRFLFQTIFYSYKCFSRSCFKPRYIIQNWLRNRNTIEFLGVWETLYNPNFNRVEFDAFRSQAGLNSFVMTPQKWVDATGAIGIVSKAGRYGRTYAHKEIAFEFASWISVEFKLYLVKEFERLKTEEMKQLGWDIKRNLAKINYRIHTDAIKENLIPPELSARQISLVYANEADVLNMALLA